MEILTADCFQTSEYGLFFLQELFSDRNSSQIYHCKLANYKDAFSASGTGEFVLHCCLEKQYTNHFVFRDHPFKTSANFHDF